MRHMVYDWLESAQLLSHPLFQSIMLACTLLNVLTYDLLPLGGWKRMWDFKQYCISGVVG